MGFSEFIGSPGGQAAVQGGFSIGGNLFSAREAKKANRRNVKLYRENRDWEENMANTSWQRGVADMQAAGINPMVAFSQGGAPTPTTSAATVTQEPKWSGAANSAAKAANLLALRQQEANINLTNASAYKATQEGTTAAAVAKNAPDMANYQMNEARQRVFQLQKQNDLTEAQARQIIEMLPLLAAASRAQTKLTDQQSTSAQQTRELQKLEFPEAEATAKWFESFMGGGGRLSNALKDILQILRMTRSK